jgi:hypothetical protein
VVTLSGRLDLDSVEELAACTDEICRSAVRGARTLAAAFRCLASNEVVAWVRSVGSELQAMLDQLALRLPLLPVRSVGAAARGRVGTVAAPRSADVVGVRVALQGAADGLGIGYPGCGDGSHDGAELASLLRSDPVEE